MCGIAIALSPAQIQFAGYQVRSDWHCEHILRNGLLGGAFNFLDPCDTCGPGLFCWVECRDYVRARLRIPEDDPA
jgi:hypothetical protein